MGQGRDTIRIHHTSEVEENVQIGRGTSIWQNCIIQEGAEIGEGCNIGANVFIEKGVKIGNRVKIKNNIALYSGIICEDDVFLGPNCVFTNVLNPRSFIDRKGEFKVTLIKKGATVGANATVVCGNTIGIYAMVGAGAVITHNVADYSLVYGNPARHRGYVCRCGCRLDENFKCHECGRKYLSDRNSVIQILDGGKEL